MIGHLLYLYYKQFESHICPSLSSKAPVELFCGLPLLSPLDFCMDPKQRNILELPELSQNIESWLAATKFSIRAMHKHIISARAQQIERSQRRPYQITHAETHSFVVLHLVSGEETDVHASRLKFYADSSLQIAEEIRERVSVQGQILAVEEFLDCRWNAQKKGNDNLDSWKGLEPIDDSRESVKSLTQDIPTLMRRR
ncbi:Hypothetical protein PHPALM_17065 [Phytophthora palmivora]|uniref:Uncharacterized protein n=1 Tax=Phytophthora palmivora TaxID=4796 RepID=A0A2P4XN75_9STRA|nr:Hypothetical protein PHPALM_17065 [Phytophthora palmivora]